MPLQVVSPNASTVHVLGGDDLHAWREKHRMPVPGHEHMHLFKRGRWDGTRIPGEWCRQRAHGWEMRCSRGLLPRILHDLGQLGAPTAASDAQVSAFMERTANAQGLRDYQQRALRLALTNGWGRIAFATNAGKGAIISLAATFAIQHGKSPLILCDEKAVFDALLTEVREWSGHPVHCIKAGSGEPPRQGLRGQIVLAMVPTLAKRLGDEMAGARWKAWLATQDMVLLDEADKATSQRWKDILIAATGSVWRIGFSGSFPEDLYHDVIYDELMGPMLDRVKNMEMIERGISARPTIEVHAFADTEVLRPFHRDWYKLRGPEWRNFVYDHVVVYNNRRHEFIANLLRPGVPTAIVVNRIDHGDALERHIPGSVFLDGSTSDAQRLGTLEAFRLGQIQVIIVTKILDRGTNRLGYAGDLIFASSEGSVRQTLQRIGRGLRRSDGKAFLRLVDIVDHLGSVGANKKLGKGAAYLREAARKRLEVYAAEGFDVQMIKPTN